MKKRGGLALRSPGLFAKRPKMGLLLFVIGSLIFLALAINLTTNGPLLGWDTLIAKAMYTLALQSPAWVTTSMIAGYYIGLQGIAASSIVLGLYFLYKK